MANDKNRTCMMCGAQYKFCSHCNDFDPSESWKYLYHDQKCKDLGQIWYAYRGNEITKEQAKKRMEKIKPNIDDVLKYTSIAANEIKEIFGSKEEIVEEIAEDKKESEGEQKDFNSSKNYQKIQYKNSKPKTQADK